MPSVDYLWPQLGPRHLASSLEYCLLKPRPYIYEKSIAYIILNDERKNGSTLQFLKAAVIYCYELGGLKQQRCIFHSSESQKSVINMSQGHALSEGSRKKPFLPLSVSHNSVHCLSCSSLILVSSSIVTCLLSCVYLHECFSVFY